MKIIIPGGSGQIGNVISNYLITKKHEIVILSRSPNKAKNSEKIRFVEWDGKSQAEWCEEIDGSDVVINLAGKNVNCRYTQKNRDLIMSSRVDSTKAIGDAIINAKVPPSVWLQASTATIYAHTFDEPNDENGLIGGNEENIPQKWDFSVKVATAWEETADSFDLPKTRLVKLRTSLVMDPYKGGIFDTLMTLVRFGLGGRAGSGKQYVSWIHFKDFIKIIDKIINESEIEGIINVTSPNPLNFNKFMSNLRDAHGINFGLPATKWMLEIGAFFMRSETELILKSRYVVPGKLTQMKYDFDFPYWKAASKDLVTQWKELRN